MKALVALTIVVALTQSVAAGGLNWFDGDIGLASPFTSASSPSKSVTVGGITNRKIASKPKEKSKRRVARSEPTVAGNRVTES